MHENEFKCPKCGHYTGLEGCVKENEQRTGKKYKLVEETE